jgi:hypothetical protein
MADRLLTRSEAAEHARGKGARLSAATIATWASRGYNLKKLPVVKVGGRAYVRQSDLDRMLGLEDEPAEVGRPAAVAAGGV